ncbi:MAG TPA: hypothetical protein VL137_18820 [Polyangiaceae bacterium]|nr:hypothetical protein [Polyangiaceae bacterium]
MPRFSPLALSALVGFACSCSSKSDPATPAPTSAHTAHPQHPQPTAQADAASDAGGRQRDSGVVTDGGPTRPIAVSDDRPTPTVAFYPQDADPNAVTWYPTQQVARFERSVAGQLLPVRAKLVVLLNGVGNAAGPTDVGQWLSNRGFHTFAVDYDNLNSVRLLADSVPGDGLPGAVEAYSEIIDGVDTSPNVTVPRADSVLGRLDSALPYLDSVDPGADWGYYLNPDGSARLTDVIFYGYSFGAATATVLGKRYRVARVVATAGPRYNPAVSVEWEASPSVTPLDRFYGIVGALDPDVAEMRTTIAGLGWPGDFVDVTSAAPPYGGSHRLQDNEGHSAMCTGSALDPVCEYAFGISP